MKLYARPSLSDVLLFQPGEDAHSDARGTRYEGHRLNELSEIVGTPVSFVASNVCYSAPHSLRGLHYQEPDPQGKLVRCLHGSIFDAVVDVRPHSQTFGQWFGYHLDDVNRLAIWIPPGFAHGFLCGAHGAVVHYECTSYFRADCARELLWNDPAIGIVWPRDPRHPPVLSDKDRRAPPLQRRAA